MSRPRVYGTLLVCTLLWGGCATEKSANPLSPTVAGPLPGVAISAPVPMAPTAGAKVPVDQQPITLTFGNARTNGVRPLTYVVDLALDADFNTTVFSRTGLTPGDGDQTSIRLPDALATGRTYYWRLRAGDGANAGPFSPTANFDVYTPVVIGRATPLAPIDNVTVQEIQPTFQIAHVERSGPAGPISYQIEIGTSDSFAGKMNWTVQETPGQTNLIAPVPLLGQTRYYWHVRAYDATAVGAWSATQTFLTAAGLPGAPGPGSGPAPGDELDLSKVIVVKGPGNIASWPATSTMTDAYEDGANLCMFHTKLGQWPTVAFFGDPSTLIEGNQWVLMQQGGQWYAGAADWYRPGQACKGVTAQSIGADSFYNASEEPLHSWVPHHGEVFGVMATTPARAWPDMSTVDERTNVVLITWP